jgi:hypothetical protein
LRRMGKTESRILGLTRSLPNHQRQIFDRIFRSGDGYVLDFSDRTMSEWFSEKCGFAIFQERFQQNGTSKAKTLRAFVEVAEPRLVAQVMRDLWSYRKTRGLIDADPAKEVEFKSWFDQFVIELEAASSLPLEDAIRNFSEDTTLAKLTAAIASDLIGEKPDVALDRVHTYCVKRMRHILAAKGKSFDKNTPLDALFGAYSRILKDTGAVSEFALPALRVQYKMFESLNHARNNRSLAHDNELMDFSEAKFVIDSTLASLAFIERLEAAATLPPNF